MPVVYIEADGALLRGPSLKWPSEVYSFRQGKWLPYAGKVPKPVDYAGEVITQEAAEKWIEEEAA